MKVFVGIFAAVWVGGFVIGFSLAGGLNRLVETPPEAEASTTTVATYGPDGLESIDIGGEPVRTVDGDNVTFNNDVEVKGETPPLPLPTNFSIDSDHLRTAWGMAERWIITVDGVTVWKSEPEASGDGASEDDVSAKDSENVKIEWSWNGELWASSQGPAKAIEDSPLTFDVIAEDFDESLIIQGTPAPFDDAYAFVINIDELDRKFWHIPEDVEIRVIVDGVPCGEVKP